MSYRSDFLTALWEEYLSENKVQPDEVDPRHFLRFTYARALAHRQPLYQSMAKWGVTVSADRMGMVRTPGDFDDVIAEALEPGAN